MSQTILHAAASRGGADHGWLKSFHTFSFAGYYNPERINFGALRVLNDDIIAGARGFGEHPHDNMEIISIPLKGVIQHKDSMGNVGIIEPGEIQVMSAGTGIQHSEYNKEESEPLELLQIWVFPNKRNVEPRYDQQKIETTQKPNQLVQVLSPNADDAGVWIHQDAWFNMGKLSKGTEIDYSLKRKGNGAYVFIIDGEVRINGQTLQKRDGFGIWDTANFTITVIKDAEILIMDVPMEV